MENKLGFFRNEQIRETGEYGINLPDFTNPAVAARAWAEEVERRQIAENQRDEAIRIKYKGVDYY
ncbi:MAG: hypothetical protein LBP36_03825 [Oscillospiraceae bacterium]|jgi:hypothetical protein|nr:hypothetical protein [Oscillospiraceae bacterium]